MSSIIKKPDCIILAGGEGKRMHGIDKGLAQYKNTSLIESVIEKIKPQVSNIVISANRNVGQYKSFGYPVVTDLDLDSDSNQNNNIYRGPLAGIAAALPSCMNEWVFIIACDMPLIPDTIVSQLKDSLGANNLKEDVGNIADNKKTIAIAEVDSKLQLAILLNKNLLSSIQFSLEKNQLKLMQWVNSNQVSVVTFSDENEFRNFNYFKDLL